MDFNRNFSPPEVQEQWFAAQVQLALELRKPLFMHCRDAGAKFAEILGAAGFGGSGVPGMLHCFTGNGEELQQCLNLGLHIGITGWVSTCRDPCISRLTQRCEAYQHGPSAAARQPEEHLYSVCPPSGPVAPNAVSSQLLPPPSAHLH